ncbi:unnamed protein product [Caenorhabditis brenneri]
MSLSRSARFPFLKLTFLCHECVIKSWDIFDIILFALISKRTRQIVKHLKIPLNGVKISVRVLKWVELDSKRWNITRTQSQSLLEDYPDLRKYCLVLRNIEIPLYSSKTGDGLVSYTDVNEVTALKLAMEFLTEVFKCSVETVWIDDDNFPKSGEIGVKSTVNLIIGYTRGYAQSQKLNLLLENLEVTGTCKFLMTSTEKDFYVDPNLFKCKKLVFSPGSAAWVTRDILLLFEVPRLQFLGCWFFEEDIAAFITQWFHSDNDKLEYLYISLKSGDYSLQRFPTTELNPVPFSERNRVPLTMSFTGIDFSKGLEIVRHDGLSASIHVKGKTLLFYVWHNQ